MKNFNVSIINPTSDELNEAFGINSDRAIEITKECRIVLIKFEKVSECIKNLSDFCKHENELAYSCFCLGVIQSEDRLDPMDAIFRMLQKRKK